MTTDKIERAKELAAQAALEAYTTTLVRLLHEDKDLRLAPVLHGTAHFHSALMVDPNTGDCVVVRSMWSFSSVSADIAEALRRRSAGEG